ncbi:hypothetical protein JK636_22170 [Clostridium sp. YIM B02515]|uniref:DUF7852 domain-containing protein n=1 Tax=Clostridium rhizosphaerae TaxID=2803861 RepID=A0ABS1TI10_9CLOT|nr:hypothetical protein [Clostridium rhizosphaerae]MBL4938422.1 hypothetical protein [Clostridium rhizosphaerae]
MYNGESYNEESSLYETKCEGKIVEEQMIGSYPEEKMHHMVTVKVPVVIGEFTVQIDVESKIKLPEKALEIKRIKKNIYLTQCRLVAHTNKVFIKGFVRKNIEFATISCVTHEAICGDIKHATVHVPFHCVAEVKCLRPAELKANPPSKEIIYFDEKNMGADIKQQDLISKERFNERVFCELEHSSIYEADIVEDSKPIEGHTAEHEFQTFIEKEVIYLTLKLLQNQQVGESCEEPEDACRC